jgi:hypothetical protein
MTMPSASPEIPAAPTSTSPHSGGESRDDGSLAQLHDSSASLDIDTSILPPLPGTSSLKLPMPDDNKKSGSKRKLEDSDLSPVLEASSDNVSDAEEKSRAGKKLKEERQDDEERISDARGIGSLVSVFHARHCVPC